LARRADGVTVASRTLQTQMWGFGVPPARVFYLPNGPDRLYREQRAVSPAAQRRLRQALGVGAAPLALYIGHISYGSEVDLVIEALTRVIEHVPELRVVIIGDGKGLPALQEKAHTAGLTTHVIFTGRIDPVQTPVYLAAADLALYPYRDTLVNRAKSPSKITAYMAMGKPIVASAVGENVAYLDGGQAGELVTPGDARAFAEGMLALLRNPDRAAELGRRAERRIWAEYDWGRQVIQLEQAYRLALQKDRTSGVRDETTHD
jgi:glycosyltransferase involved in cell wall biosynthesis